jgi:hypothetical protein
MVSLRICVDLALPPHPVRGHASELAFKIVKNDE